MSKNQKATITPSATPSASSQTPSSEKKGFIKSITSPFIVHVAVPAILSLHVRIPIWAKISKPQTKFYYILCDFYRFLCGWGEWGYDLKGKVLTLLQCLDGGKNLGTEEAYKEAMKNKFW